MFIDINVFGRSAEIANQYLKKGSKVLVDGRLTFEQWTDQNGQNRSKHSLTVETIIMLDKKENSTGNINNGGYNPQYQSRSFASHFSMLSWIVLFLVRKLMG